MEVGGKNVKHQLQPPAINQNVIQLHQQQQQPAIATSSSPSPSSYMDSDGKDSTQTDQNDVGPLDVNKYIDTLKRKVEELEQKRERQIRSDNDGFKHDFELTQNERLWLMKEKNQYIDSIISTVGGHQEHLHMDIFLSLAGNIQQSLKFLMDIDQKPIKQYEIDADVDGELLKYITMFAYQRELKMDDDTIWIKLADYASKYQVEKLVHYCLDNFLNKLEFNNSLKGYELSLRFPREGSNLFKEFVEDNFEEIWLKHKSDLLKKDENLLYDLLSSPKLNLVNEEIVWNVICQWIAVDQSNRHQYLPLFLDKCLRYGRLHDDYFENSVLQHEFVQQLPSQTQSDLKQRRMVNKGRVLETEILTIDGYGLYLSNSLVHFRPRETKHLLLVAGGWVEGQTTHSWEIYDYQTNLWLSSPEITLNKKVSYFGLELVDDTIYVFGGSNGKEIYSILQAMNLNSSMCRWENKCSMIESRCYVSSATLNGHIYAIGGFNQRNRMRKCERYNPTLDLWQEIAELNFARSDASAVAHNGKIFIAGGINDSCIERSVEIYDPEANKWILVKAMNTPRTSFAICSFQNMVWALGGNNGTIRCDTVECYDLEDDVWIEMPKMLHRRSTFRAHVLRNELYAVGGYNGQSPISNVEKYVPDKGWIEVKELRHDRSGLSLITLPNKFNFLKF